MSTTIDEKVVSLGFDNKQFENNVQTSLTTLERLKQGLNLTGASKGLEQVGQAAKNSSAGMSVLGDAANVVVAKFSHMQMTVQHQINNLVDSAIRAGKRISSALTIDPIKTGFSEYETQINAVQTILANTESKGTTIDDVNGALDELNTYADKTIYNFTEMTRNIGTFTAAGVDLDKSVTSIKGIANLAAVSGSTSQQASTAMYQLSQALASGKVSLMDWNSVVNAGMGGEVFQNALKRTARNATETAAKLKQMSDEQLKAYAEQHGYSEEQVEAMRDYSGNVDKAIEKYGTFRDSLTQGDWLSSEVLTETLTQLSGAYTKAELLEQGYTEQQADEILKLADTAENAATKVKTFTQLWDTLKESAQSGWTQSWEIIIGDFEEAKETLTKVSDVIGAIINDSAEQRNKLLQGWKDLGGRDDLLAGIKNAFTAVTRVVKTFTNAFREIFPPMTAEQLYNITKGFKEFTLNLIPSADTLKKMKSTFKGFFAILDIGKQLLGAVFKAIKPLFGATGDLGGGILNITAKLGDWLVALDETIKKTDIFGKAAEKIANFIELVREGITLAVNETKKFFSSFKVDGKYPALEKLGDLFDRLKEHLKGFKDALSDTGSITGAAMKSISNAFMNSNFLGGLQALWDGVKKIFGGIFKAIGELLGPAIEKIGNGDFTGFIEFINTLLTGGILTYLIKFADGLGEIVENSGGLKDGFLDILDQAKNVFSAYQNQLNAEALKKIAVAIAILAGSLFILSLANSDNLSSAVTAMTILFADLMGGLALFNKFGGDSKGLVRATTAMVAVAAAVFILAGALTMISTLSLAEIGKGVLGIAGLTAIVIGAAKILGKGDKTIIKGATRMVIFAAAIKIFASVCKDLAQLNVEQLAKGLGSIAVLMATISLFINKTDLSKKGIASAIGIVIIASAMKILASACKDFGSLDTDVLVKGVLSIGTCVAALAMSMSKIPSKGMLSAGISIVIIASAMKILASACKDFGSLNPETLVKGIVSMGTALAAITIALTKMPTTGMISAGIGIIAISTAMLILAQAVKQMGTMKLADLAKGVIAMGAAMAIIAAGAHFMKGSVSGAASMIVMAGALALLTPVLVTLGKMPIKNIGKALLMLAGTFAVLGIAGAVLGPLVPVILSLAGALALIGLSVVGIGAGLVLIGAGLSAISIGIAAFGTSIAAGATAIVAGLTVIITGIGSLIPVIVKYLGNALIVFCQVIADGAPAIGEAIKSLVLTVIDVLVECVPALADGILSLVSQLLIKLNEYTPTILSSLFEFILALIRGLSDYIPDFIQAGFDLIGSIFQGIIDALGSIDVSALIAGTAAVGLMAGVMVALSAITGLIPGAMLGVLGIAGVVAEIALLLAAFGALAQIPGLQWLIGEGGEMLATIGNAIGKAIGSLIGGIGEGITGSLPAMATDLSNFMTNLQPFLDGARTIDASLGESMKSLATALLALTGAELLDQLASWITGGSSLADFGAQLAIFGPYMKQYADSVAGINPATVLASTIAAQALSELATNLPNSGGVASWFAGENDIDTFGEKLVPFGESMVAYSNAIAGMDAEAVTASATAALALAELADNLPNSGGVASWFAGENDIDTFGEKLIPFGECMKLYSDAVVGIDADAISASSTAAKALSELADNLPNSGGVASWFAGENDIDDFGAKIVPFGECMKSYSDAVVGIDSGAISASATAAKSLSELADNLPNSGGVISWFAGNNDINDFGSKLASFGKCMKKYSDSVAGINRGNIATATATATMMVTMLNSISSVNTKGVPSFVTAINTLGEASVEKFIEAFNVPTAQLANIGSNLIDGIITGIETKRAELVKLVTEITEGMFTRMGAHKGKFHKTGIDIIDRFISGVERSMSKLKTSVSKIINSTLSAMRAYYTSFYSVGSYLVSGFASGISSNTYKATAKSRAMAAAAARAAREELDEHSPSKVGYEIGDFFGVAFVDAIDKYADKAYGSGENLASSAKSGLSLAMDRVNGILSGTDVMEPTIRPVVDLSDVRAGAASIGSMFSFGTPISVLANVGAINSRVAQRNQNGGNEDVVSAIDKLRSGLNNLGNTTYSINGLTVTSNEVEEAIETLIGAIIRDRRS